MSDEPPKADDNQTIIVKKIINAGGHHGGAWKVAYADFVTAMMAFFLLLWLLNVSSDEQLNAISNYFDPSHPVISSSTSGAGGVMGGLSMAPQGAMTTNKQTLTKKDPTGKASSKKEHTSASPTNLEKAKEILRKQEESRMKNTADELRKEIESDPDLKDLAKNLIIDMTSEGLRIQIVDQDGKPLFASGSARMFERTQKLLTKVSSIIQRVDNELSIRGHTDGVPYGKGSNYTNWELSADRANSSRRVLEETGIPAQRLSDVVGKADTQHLLPDTPADPQNRRISIILLKEELTNGADFDQKAKEIAKTLPAEEEGNSEGSETASPIPQVPVGTFRRTPGSVEFP